MIAEIIKQVFLRGAVFREYDDLLVHLLDQLDGFSALVLADSLDEIDELPDFIATESPRQLLGQINKSHENGIAAAAHFTLERNKGQHTA